MGSSTIYTTQRKRAGHKACYHGSPATSVRKANFLVKVVVLECCVKTVCLVPEITDILNSDETQRKYDSGAAERNLKSRARKTR